MPSYALNRVRINDTDRTILAEILPINSLPATKPNLQYYWYGSNMIHVLQGGFGGQLLNGLYTEYYPDKNLKTQGRFDKGLKSGTWKDWDDKGVLTTLVNWKDGAKSGRFSFYNSDGSLRQTGSYQKNELDGTVTSYVSKDSVQTVQYREGKVISPDRRSLLKRINIFSKKDKLKNQ